MTRLPARAGLPSRCRTLALVLLAGLLGAASAGTPAASASVSCTSQNLSVQSLQSGVFYIDAATNYLGSYVGYRIGNTDGAARSGLWVRLEHFQGGTLGPADGGGTTSPVPVDALAAGAASPAYAYLKAAAATTTAQSYDVVLYAGRPGAGGTEVCRAAQSVSSVQDVIKAAANKVTSAVLAPASAALGGTFKLTVTGSTGTIGAGIASDPGIVRFSPAVAAAWPSSAFRLVGVTNQFPTGAAGTADVLSLGGMSGPDRAYTITYTFRVVGPTAAPTPVMPVQNIASGTQVKHTDPGTLGSLAPIPQVTSDATFAAAAGPGAPYPAGSAVALTATVTNAAATAISLDEIVAHLPAGWGVVPGSATVAGASVADPFVAGGGTLHLVGPFTVPAHGTLSVGLSASAGTAGSSGSFTVVGLLDGGQIDATADPSDDVPATVALRVLGAPTAADDVLSAAAGTTTALDVLANDDTTGAAPTLSIVTAAGHGTATVSGGHLDYTPDDGYTGPDTLTYRLTTAGGSDDADVTLSVAAPPAAPSPGNVTSSGTGTAPQHATLTVPAGDTVRLLAGGLPATTLTTPGEGTYVLDPLTGVVTFTPVLGFTGPAAPVTYRVTDSFGQDGEATYTPSVAAPALAAPAPRTSSGVGTALQTASLPVPASGAVRLLDGGVPALSVAVDGEGLYVLDPASGAVSFTPEPAFHGAASGVGFRITDAYTQTADSTYTPTVTLPAAPAPAGRTSTGVGAASQTQTLDADPVQGETAALLGSGGAAQTTVTVSGEGRYDLAGVTVTFTPAAGFHGTATGVGYRVTDRYGQTGDATYTPAVTPPAPPAPADLASTGEGTAPQSAEPAVPAGGTLVLLDALGQPATTVAVAGQGTFTVDPLTGRIRFTPLPGFAGTASPVTYRVTDIYGQSAVAHYLPAVTPPAAPAPAPATSTGNGAAAQTVTLAVPPAGTITLLDASGAPATHVVVAGVGTYDLDPASATVTFTPSGGFVGTPDPVRYRVTDVYGQSREATYTPTVVALAVTPPAAPPAPTGTAPAARRQCVSRRVLVIHWKVARGVAVRRQQVTVQGRPARTVAGGARRFAVDLRGLSPQRVVVHIRATTGDGHILKATRAFRTCSAPRAGAPLRTLVLRPHPR